MDNPTIDAPFTTEQLRELVTELFAAFDAVNAEMADCGRRGELRSNAQMPSWPRYAAVSPKLMPALRSWILTPASPAVGSESTTKAPEDWKNGDECPRCKIGRMVQPTGAGNPWCQNCGWFPDFTKSRGSEQVASGGDLPSG